MSTLYLVATPIGNLEDISARALRILGEVPLIAAEDTRHTGKLLHHFGIHTRLTSYHDHNKGLKAGAVLDALASGDVALVSDAGTPTINDPGYELVRLALQAGHTVTPIPGPSAPLAALSASGLPTDAFLYLGYLPRKASERRTFLQNIAAQPYTLIFLETPHRLLDALADLLSILGDRPAAAARELTKQFEEFVRGPLSDIQAHFQAHEPRGEFTLVVGGQTTPAPTAWDESAVHQALQEALARGLSPKDAAKAVSEASGWNKRAVYALAAALKPTPSGEKE